MTISAINPASQLTQEIQAAQQLLELLKQEQAFLIEADIDGLASLTKSKSSAVSRLTELAIARHRNVGKAGFAASESGMQQWLASAAGSSAMASWSQLLDVMQSSKELNHTNGILINTHMTRNQASLAVLQQNAQGGAFYGPNGQATVKPVGRGMVIG
jgi:flagella synthesis protein FlgN